MLFWTKEREAGVWDFKGRAGKSQVGEEEQTRGDEFLLGRAESGARSGAQQTAFAGLLRLPRLV